MSKMNRENKFLLLNTLILLVIGLLVILVYSNLAVTTKADKIFGSKVKLEAVEGSLPTKMNEAYDVYKGGLKVGKYFDVSETNDYGTINLLIGIDTDDNILGIYQDINQAYPESHHQEQVYSFLNALIGKDITKIDIDNITESDLDGVTKPTTVVTLGSVGSLFEVITNFIATDTIQEPVEPEEGVEFVEYVIEDNNLIGATYQITKDSPNTEPGGATERLSFKFTIDLDYKITAFEEVWYKHTAGGFKVQTIGFLESIVGKTINEVSNITLVDGETGATNSKNGIIGLIKELETYLEDNPLTLDPIVKEVEENVYNVKKLAFYFRNYGYLSYNVTLNETGEIVSYDEVSYGHSEGNWKDIATAYFDSLVGKNIDDINHDLTDGQTGATNSSKTIRDMLIALAEFIKEVE